MIQTPLLFEVFGKLLAAFRPAVRKLMRESKESASAAPPADTSPPPPADSAEAKPLQPGDGHAMLEEALGRGQG